ncbi:glycoside hydrolase family 43 protein [Deinococcus altitudinis]|uniref:glycoside hydrolase family 43 protein n=1 Tax=Deinococcus altitudinis TaxID=468914 RepID=UPI0038918FBC
MNAPLTRLVLTVAASLLLMAAAVSRTFSNPVLAEDVPDPSIVRVGSGYYAYSTNAAEKTVPVYRSSDLVHWKAAGDALPALPSWASAGFTWAPDVMKVRGGYALYFTARHTESGRQCIGVAFAAQPKGPFVSRSPKPLVCQVKLGGSIDASGFTDQNGKQYLYWKSDGNCCALKTGLWVQPLGPDGLTLTGTPRDLIDNGQPWEGNLIEAPFVYRHADQYYLFYSAAAWDSASYAVGYAVGPSPTGPFRKSAANPLLKTAGNVAGPGGEGVITDARNQAWMYYHAWSASAIGYPSGQRALYLSRLEWKGAAPVVKPGGTPQTAPVTP